MSEKQGFVLLRLLGLETRTVDLVSPLRRDECVRRLREHVDTGLGLYGTRSVIGQVGETSFTLRRRVGYRNNFRTILRGTFLEESRGTRLHCRSGAHPVARALILFWLAAVLVGACAFAWPIIASLIHGKQVRLGTQLGTLVVPALMFCFGVALTKVGRRMARGEDEYLIGFLTKQLDAREAPAAEGLRETAIT
jgi:hypothetical protein